jgi:hypothetical protein
MTTKATAKWRYGSTVFIYRVSDADKWLGRTIKTLSLGKYGQDAKWDLKVNLNKEDQ